MFQAISSQAGDQRQLMILANQFLSTTAFLMLKAH
jgi:hypothetical protein